ncbi:Helix-turn-helix conjugative transposon-like domain-containing protein, partial [Dysosmobacter welbionis]
YRQGLPAQGTQGRTPERVRIQPLHRPGQQAAEKMPRQEQEQPGQQGEIIRGEKVRRRKSYVRRQQITVKSLRYRSQRPVLK